MSASLLRPDFCVNKVPDKGQFEIALFCYPDGVTVVMKNGYFEFLTHFVDLTDPREERGRNHLLMDMVGITLCGTICGANTWADIERFCVAHQDWFSEFLELPNGVPSHDNFGRVFRVLDTQQ